MSRLTKHSYPGPGSLERCVEAGIALADASSEDDVAYHRAYCRFRAAVNAYADRRAAEKAREALQAGPGSTIAPGPGVEEGAELCAPPAASCGSEALAS